jgi:tetratricopeptide (TPR) repeat protein
LQTKLLTLRENTLGPNHPDILLSLGKLAEVKRELQKYPELEAIYSRSLVLRENLKAPNGELAFNLFELGFNYHFQGRYAEDKQLFKRAIGLWKQDLQKDPTNIEALKGCALVYATVGQLDKASGYYKRALTVAKKKNGPNSKTEAEILDYLSGIQKTRKAEATVREQALIVTKAASGPESLATAKALHELGCAYKQDGNRLHAKNCFEQALNIREKLLPPNHPDIADSLFSLASCDLFLHRYAEAEPLYWLSIGITQEIFGPRHGLVSYRIQDGPALLCQDTKDWGGYKVLSDYAQSFHNGWKSLPRPPKYDL